MDIAENRRLSPLFEIGYRIYRGGIAVPEVSVPAPEEPLQGWSEEAYRRGLEREIAESFSARPGTLEYLVACVHDGSLTGFNEEDCAAAVRLLDTFLRCALFVQSNKGDGRDAESELRSDVPGLPVHLYSDVLGYCAYVNH